MKLASTPLLTLRRLRIGTGMRVCYRVCDTSKKLEKSPKQLGGGILQVNERPRQM